MGTINIWHPGIFPIFPMSSFICQITSNKLQTPPFSDVWNPQKIIIFSPSSFPNPTIRRNEQWIYRLKTYSFTYIKFSIFIFITQRESGQKIIVSLVQLKQLAPSDEGIWRLMLEFRTNVTITKVFRKLCFARTSFLKAHSKVWDYLWQLKALLKWRNVPFISPKNLFSFSRYLGFCLDFFGHVWKRLDKKDLANFEIHDVTTWLTNNFSTHITQYLKEKKEPDNEIWSVNTAFHK